MMSCKAPSHYQHLRLCQFRRPHRSLTPIFFSFHFVLDTHRRSSHCHHTRRHQTNDILFVDIFLVDIFLINILLVTPFLLHYSLPSSLPSNTSTSSSTTSYSSHRIVAAPTTVTVTWRAVLTMPQSSPSCSLPPTSYRPCRQHPR